MNRSLPFTLAGLALFVLLLGACVQPSPVEPDQADRSAIYTAAAQTITAELALAGAGTPVAPLEEPVIDTPPSTGAAPVEEIDLDAWQRFEDQSYGFSFRFPADWTYQDLPVDEPNSPPMPGGIVRHLMIMPQSVADEMASRSGPPDPEAPPLYAPLFLDVSVASLEEYRQGHVEPEKVEQLLINDQPVNLEYCGYGSLCYVFQSPTNPDLRVTILDVVTAFPERAEGNQQLIAEIEAILSSIEFDAEALPVTQPDLEPVVEHTPQPIIEASPQPLVETSPTLGLQVIFKDDFSDSRGWFKIDREEFRFEYINEAYSMYNNLYNDSVWSIRDQEHGDAIFEVEASWQSGTQDGYYGLTCRFQDSLNYYTLVVGSDGFYGIGLKAAGKYSYLARSTVEEAQNNTAIQPGRGTNLVQAACIGNSLALYLNGQKLLEVEEDTLTGGKAGLVVGTSPTPGIEVVFDDFIVYQP